MSHPENCSPDCPSICVSRSDSTSKTECVGADALQTGHHPCESHPMAGVPVTRGPGDVWHSEAYLISWLVRTHGWRVIEPGVMWRIELPKRSVTRPENRQAGIEQLKQGRAA